MSIDTALLALLVDPEDHESLWYVESESLLYNPRTKRVYSVASNGIPTLLATDATTADDQLVVRMESAHREGKCQLTGVHSS